MNDMETIFQLINAFFIKMKKSKPSRRKILRKKIVMSYCLFCELEDEVSKANKGRIWVRNIFRDIRKYQQGDSQNLCNEMRFQNKDMYYNYLRMTSESFDKLLHEVGPKITKQLHVRDPIPPKTRLEVTLRYLASGDSMSSLAYAFRIGVSTVSGIIFETCTEIWNCLKDTVFFKPTAMEWLKKAEEFELLWDFPHCIGAIDGKHIIVQAPVHSGSVYYNYKGSHSIQLLAIADAKYSFLMVDIGAAGRQRDGGVFRTSALGQNFQNGLLHLPQPSSLQVDGIKLPYVLVADEAFPLTNYMMRPYPKNTLNTRTKKVYNYRLSRARRMIECSFGILTARWRIFRKPIIANTETVKKITAAAVCLHNFILQCETTLENCNFNLTLQNHLADATGIVDISRTGSNTYSRNASLIRNEFAAYFENSGAVSWQWEKVLQNDF